MATKSPAKKATKKKAGGSPTLEKAGSAIVHLKNHAEAAKDPKVAQNALDAIAEIQKNWTKWTEAKALQKKVGFECKEKTEADEAALKVAIEEPIPVSPVDEKIKGALKKIELVEMRWQELENTKAANTEHRKAAKERVANWLEKLQRSLSESSQLTLPAPGMK